MVRLGSTPVTMPPVSVFDHKLVSAVNELEVSVLYVTRRSCGVLKNGEVDQFCLTLGTILTFAASLAVGSRQTERHEREHCHLPAARCQR
jgi:hypothetical protein